MLKIENLCTGYDDLRVIFNANLEVNEGEVVALVGSNGAGKTTLLRVISGAIPVTEGTVTWFGEDLLKIPDYERANLGIAHIPQGRGVLSTMTIRDNLIMGGYCKRTKAKRNELIEKVFETFPILKERQNLLAGALSGGQQQMLAIGRAMIMEPKLLILDEPSLGLAPIIVDEVFHILKQMKEQGTSMLIIEQNLMKALSVADRGYVMETGQMVLEGSSQELLQDPMVLKAYLGVS
jgi:branched-chain amino acid transport system ATP-binding protein